MVIRIGDRGRAASPLYPSGRALIGTVPMVARAERGPIDQGSDIVVVGGDQFSLLVREFSADHSDADLPRFGEPILTAKEEAALQAAEIQETRRVHEEDHRRVFRRILAASMVFGFLCGVGLLVAESYRASYSHRLLWLPVLSVALWSSLVFLAFWLGAATETLLVFLSIPFSIAGMVVGVFAWGPFVGLGLSFVVGVI